MRRMRVRWDPMNLRTAPLPALALALAIAITGCTSSPPQQAAPAAATAYPRDSWDLADVAGELGGTGRTLLVLDIDDTLLTSPRFYGSDDWFGWQNDPATPAARKVPCPFDVIAMNAELGTQERTQDNGPDLINPLVRAHDTIILTSRNPAARGATIGELRRQGYELPRQLDGKADGIAYRYTNRKTGNRVTVTYDQGVFMTEGQNKGEVLLDLLGKDHLNMRYQRIVLVDDGPSNHTNMKNALDLAGIEYRGLLYRKAKKTVTEPMRIEADAAWRALSMSIELAFPDRMYLLNGKTCRY